MNRVHSFQSRGTLALSGTPEASQMNEATIDQCPRWDSCSANYCPVDGGNMHLRDEATCYYMRQALKEVPTGLLNSYAERFAYEAANDHIAMWDDLPSALKRDLTKSVGSPPR